MEYKEKYKDGRTRFHRILYDDKLMSPFLHLVFETFSKIRAPGFHSHDYFHTMICLKGTFAYDFQRGESLVIPEGSIGILPPHLPHYWRVVNARPHCVMLKILHTAFPECSDVRMNNLFGDNQFSPVTVSLPKEIIQSHVALLMKECKKAGPASSCLVHGECLSLMAKIMRQIFLTTSSSADTNDKADRYVTETLHFIHEHYREPITLEQLSKNINLCPSRLSELFRAQTGLSPIKYINTIKARKALSLIRYSDMSLADIGRYLGFPEAQHFTRFFKKNTGIPPSRIRKSGIVTEFERKSV